jgi:transcriptional regulator with XRE-family HTH domain
VKTLGERVKYARELRGWSQNQLDKRAGFSVGRVSRIERNERAPSADTLAKLAATLGVRADWILSGLPPMEAASVEPDPVPNRAEAARLARDDGVYDAAIESVSREAVDANSLKRSVLWWADRMRLRQRELIEGTRDIGTPAPTTVIRHGVQK